MVNEIELKAGHAAAEKVGGVRQKASRSRGDSGGLVTAEPEPVEATTQEEGGEPTEEKETLEVVETAVVPPFKENTVEAVKAFHEKPLASKNVQIKNPQVVNNMHIQQPRK